MFVWNRENYISGSHVYLFFQFSHRSVFQLYPEYMERFGKRVGRDLLAAHNGHENVVLQIKKIMVQIMPLHEMLLKEIDSVCSNWDSRSPNMSKTIATYADFLKCCQPFLDNKADFLAKLLQLRNEDKEFDEATFMVRKTRIYNQSTMIFSSKQRFSNGERRAPCFNNSTKSIKTLCDTSFWCWDTLNIWWKEAMRNGKR